MTYSAQMLEAYPAEINLDRTVLAKAIDALTTCAQVCTACADACLSESPDRLPELTRCVRDNLDCADVCAATAAVLSRHTAYDARLANAQAQAAAQATQTCGDSCGEHRDLHRHCEICERVCRDTEQALRGILPHLEPTDAAPSRPSGAAPQT